MIHATIMAGGAGTRFWPASRKSTPKQLLNLTGTRSMIQDTADRVSGLCDPDRLLIVTNQSLVDAIQQQLPEIPAACILGEPAKRDTAPCIGLAAALIAARDPDATMIVMPADHVIQPRELFQQTLQHAADWVDTHPEQIVTFGITPSYPAEVFGYIERGESPLVTEPFATWPVERFREKPDLETAQQFVQSGSFYWNSGIFVWKARTILDALERFVPKMYQHIAAIAAQAGTPEFGETLEREFTAIEGTSIDYAVMERYEHVAVIEAPFQWDDLGNWTALPRQLGVDDQGNCVSGDHLGIETRNCVVRGDGQHLLVTVGLEDCIVVHTDDATLVARKTDEAKIKQVVQMLTDQNRNEFL